MEKQNSSRDREVNKNLDELISERRKTLTNCLNLECRNEQLKVLIEKLHKIASHRENLFFNFPDSHYVSEEVDNLNFDKSAIVDELQTAKKSSSNLEQVISELKDRIIKIDQMLAS